jgi:hypothetical protein
MISVQHCTVEAADYAAPLTGRTNRCRLGPYSTWRCVLAKRKTIMESIEEFVMGAPAPAKAATKSKASKKKAAKKPKAKAKSTKTAKAKKTKKTKKKS